MYIYIYINIMSNYYEKYIKYKNKYLKRKNGMFGGNVTKVTLVPGGKSQDIANHPQYARKKVGVLIAGNPGRPGGALGKMDGTGVEGDINRRFTTQEESVVASWLLAEKEQFKRVHPHSTFDPNITFRNNLGVNATLPGGGRGRPWGLMYPDKRLGQDMAKYTIQHIDFTEPFTKNDKWYHIQKYNFAYSLNDKPLFNSKDKIKNVDLVFVYGPNVGASGKTLFSSLTRTKVHDYQYHRDYEIFKRSAKMALRAGLKKMIDDDVKIAILARVSGGIYAGLGSQTFNAINSEYENLVNEILSEDYKGEKIGSYFDKVILPVDRAVPGAAAGPAPRRARANEKPPGARAAPRRARADGPPPGARAAPGAAAGPAPRRARADGPPPGARRAPRRARADGPPRGARADGPPPGTRADGPPPGTRADGPPPGISREIWEASMQSTDQSARLSKDIW
jgi:hypothetical protein